MEPPISGTTSLTSRMRMANGWSSMIAISEISTPRIYRASVSEAATNTSRPTKIGVGAATCRETIPRMPIFWSTRETLKSRCN